MKEITITKANDGQRIEKFVRHYLSEAPLGYIYKAFRKKDIKINGHWVKKDAVVHEGDVVRIYVTDAQLEDFAKPKEIEAKPFNHPIVYEDGNILIVNKPAGLLVMGDEKEKRVTLANDVLSYLYGKGEYDPHDSSFTPSPAHRLDRNTSGIIVFGKTDEALKELTLLFKERNNIDKRYLALVSGIPSEEEGTINAPLIKDETKGIVRVSKEGKEAITKYRVVEKYNDCSLLECELLTGRTHQIRVHLASIGHPILGDGKYGDFEMNRLFKVKYRLNNQFLVAYSLAFGKVKGSLAYLSGKTFKISLEKEQKNLLDMLKVSKI